MATKRKAVKRTSKPKVSKLKAEQTRFKKILNRAGVGKADQLTLFRSVKKQTSLTPCAVKLGRKGGQATARKRKK
jgi:hypothetical protein